MNPEGAGEARAMFRKSLPLLLASFADEQIRAALKQVDRLVGEDHVYDALKAIRALYALEKHIIEQGRPGSDERAQVRQPRRAGEIHP
jgi:flagellar biosynthesis repressor protein FlbT